MEEFLRAGRFARLVLFASASLVVAGIGVPAAADTNDSSGGTDSLSAWFDDWYDRVHAAQGSQPDWMTPLVTVTPRLEQEIRYDQYFETLGNGGGLDNYGSGKGLEFIPTTTNEVIFGVPPYEDRYNHKPAEGFGDWPFLLIKQRLVSADNEDGNYIVTGFLSVQAPAGIKAFTSHAWTITPTLAAGKGWGPFDIQATVGFPIPLADESTIGTAEVFNVAFQGHFARYLWPEFEINTTHWNDGARSGKTQVFLTPGIVFGRFLLGGTAKGILGVGYQFAVAPAKILDPLTPTYQHSWIISARLAF